MRSINRELYNRGRMYASGLDGADDHASVKALVAVASTHDASVAEVRTAVKFVRHVDKIADVVGPDARELMLSGDYPLLTPVFVDGLAKRSPAAISIALERARSGHHPHYGPPPAETPRVMARWWHDLSRLKSAERLLSEQPSVPRLPEAERSSVYRDATAARVAASALLITLRATEPNAIALGSRSEGTIRIDARCVSDARRRIEAVTHDLPLLMSRFSPSPSARSELVSAVQNVHAAASRVATLTGPPSQFARPAPRSILVNDGRGPDSHGGTYVLVMRMPRPTVLRIGRLDTYWLPAGYLLYVGSAFGGGGVKSRTHRHLTPGVPKMWNIDHIKAVAAPVELWWTHHPSEVECDWAMALAELSGYVPGARLRQQRLHGMPCTLIPPFGPAIGRSLRRPCRDEDSRSWSHFPIARNVTGMTGERTTSGDARLTQVGWAMSEKPLTTDEDLHRLPTEQDLNRLQRSTVLYLPA